MINPKFVPNDEIECQDGWLKGTQARVLGYETPPSGESVYNLKITNDPVFIHQIPVRQSDVESYWKICQPAALHLPRAKDVPELHGWLGKISK